MKPMRVSLSTAMPVRSSSTARTSRTTEYKLLNYLMSNTGKALSRRQILNQVWNYDYYGDLRTVDTHINRLRIKLGDKGRYIRTVRGYGYRYDGK